ncbi:MAG: hypothetical protein HY721_25005 [Planctomycetes bacterium]|nr:hypothetical protein [Planctomycetota bacterium]
MAGGRFKVPEGQKVPEHWNTSSWEEKARENPLYAVMTTPDLLDADPESFSAEHLAPFFAKGPSESVVELMAARISSSALLSSSSSISPAARPTQASGIGLQGNEPFQSAAQAVAAGRVRLGHLPAVRDHPGPAEWTAPCLPQGLVPAQGRRARRGAYGPQTRPTAQLRRYMNT